MGFNMRIIINEWKKIWNWPFIVFILLSSLFVGVTHLKDQYDSFKSMEKHGMYGDFQKELFDTYGVTLEEEELNHYNIPQKIADEVTALDQMIVSDKLFEEQGISNFKDYESALEKHNQSYEETLEYEEKNHIFLRMQEKLTENAETLTKHYDSPLVRLSSLESLKYTYLEYEERLDYYQIDSNRPQVAKAAEQIKKKRNNSLIRSDFLASFSLYLGTFTIFSLVTTILLVAPFLSMDRGGKVNSIQYVTKTGRKILWVQYFVALTSGKILALSILVLSYLPIHLFVGGKEYWRASIMSYDGMFLYLHEWTFGQAAMILVGIGVLLNLTLVSLSFILTYFSQNILTLMIKLVPLTIGFGLLTMLIFIDVFSNQNGLFENVFQGRIYLPEVFLPMILFLISFCTGIFVCSYEQKKNMI